MDSYIILAILVGIPIVSAVLFRISGILLFVGAATGILLSQYIAEDTNIVLNSFTNNSSFDQYIKLGLLLLPVLLVIVFLRKTVSAGQLVLHIVPIVVTSAALATVAMHLMPGGVAYNLLQNPFGKTANTSQNILISASALLTLILALLTARHRGGRGKHHR